MIDRRGLTDHVTSRWHLLTAILTVMTMRHALHRLAALHCLLSRHLAERSGSGSIGERAELSGTTLAAGGSTMELAREPITGAKTQSSQAAGIGLYGGHRLPLGAWPGQSRDAGSGQRIRVVPQS